MPESQRNPGDYDVFINDLLVTQDAALLATLASLESEGLPKINVSPVQGKLLLVLARMSGARRILEIGTLGGYSGIWLARALPGDGRMISLELDPHHADVSRRNFERAGLAGKVEVRTGPAAESLDKIRRAGEGPFDMIFIDANKDGYVDYLEQSVPLAREGRVILADNTLTHSALDPTADTGITRFNAAVAAHPDLITIIVPVLKNGGVDGLTVSVKVTGGNMSA